MSFVAFLQRIPLHGSFVASFDYFHTCPIRLPCSTGPTFLRSSHHIDQVSNLTGDEACCRLLALRAAAKSTPATPAVDTGKAAAEGSEELQTAVAGQRSSQKGRTVTSARHLVGHVVVLGFPARCVAVVVDCEVGGVAFAGMPQFLRGCSVDLPFH